MRIAIPFVTASVLCTAWFATRCPAGETPNLLPNPSAEEVADGRPLGWGLYRGKGKASLGVSAVAHTGKRAAVLRIEGFGEWQGAPYVNAALVAADSDGYDGSRAVSAKPNTVYRFAFWFKGDLPWVDVVAYVWSDESGHIDSRSSVAGKPRRIEPTSEWTRHECTFMTRADTRRLAPCFKVAAHAADGARTGVVLVDDVSLEEGERVPRTPPSHPIVLPAKFHPTVGGHAVEELRTALAAKKPEVVRLINDTLARADTWADKNDSWFLHRRASFTPIGLWTLACPFHPERVRDFSPDNFEWSIDDPWRLVCKFCREEGRQPPHYPNERYPDDGTGCYPTDEVWRQDHDAAWSKAHSNIPWDHWDGTPHGYSETGYCYYFLGKCAHEIMTFEGKSILPALAEGYVIARHVLPDGDPRRERAALYARRLKVALLSLARAHLGDEYLAQVAGLSSDEFTAQMVKFHTDDPDGLASRHFPGYHPYGLQDGILGDPKHPPRGSPDVYADGSYRGDRYARAWLQAYAFVRDAYTEDEEAIRQMTERILVANAADAQRLGDTPVKKGKLDLSMKPYDLTIGASNNLGGRELAAKFEFGRLLGDREAIDAVAANVWYYFRNYFTGDGLGREGSCAYTSCAFNTLSAPLELLYRYRGAYDRSHPWWDPKLRALNPYRDRRFREAATKTILSLYPDGRAIPWMDSHVEARLAVSYAEQAANEGGGAPEQYAPFFRASTGAGRTTLTPRDPLDLPSVLHHELRKALLRSGSGANQTVLGIDYAVNSGHYHPAPMDLILFAHGHELASDLGYFGAMSSLTKKWIRTCVAHNTCLIRTETGEHDFVHEAQGDLHEVIDLGGKVQVVEVSERKPDKLAHLPGPNPRYQRTTALVALDEARPYAVDFFRVRGGALHDYMFHSPGRECRADGVTLAAEPDAKTSLFDASGFEGAKSPPRGSQLIRQLQRAHTGETFSVTWQGVPDWDREGEVDADVGLRLTMLGREGTELFLGVGPGQRRMSNTDLGEKLHLACVRRRNGDAVDTFAAVIEPFWGQPFIRSVRSVPVGGAPDAAAVEVEMSDRRDLILSNPGETGARPAAQLHALGVPIRTDAAFCVVSMAGDELQHAHLVGGTSATIGKHRLELPPPYTGKLLSFDDERSTVVLQSPAGLPEGAVLRDAIMILRHEVGTSTLTIDTVRHLEADRYEVACRWTPHLAENYLRIVGTEGNWLRLQPPRSLPHAFLDLKYQVYRAGEGTQATRLGEITRTEGEWYRIDGDVSGVSVGDDVVLTRLRAGEDGVFVPSRFSVDL